jgi:glycosyltransferase involved in cell wall biosynthesis
VCSSWYVDQRVPLITDLSICIPTLKAKQPLREYLHSICANAHGIIFEIIVVDNNSQDGTVEMLKSEFPEVRLIVNDYNAGFTRPTD